MFSGLNIVPFFRCVISGDESVDPLTNIIMRSNTGTIRFIEAIHHFDFKREY